MRERFSNRELQPFLERWFGIFNRELFNSALERVPIVLDMWKFDKVKRRSRYDRRDRTIYVNNRAKYDVPETTLAALFKNMASVYQHQHRNHDEVTATKHRQRFCEAVGFIYEWDKCVWPNGAWSCRKHPSEWSALTR